MKQLSKLGISAGLAVVAVLTLSVLLDTSASAGEDGTAGTVPVDTLNVCRPDGDGTYTFFKDVTALEGDLVDGVDGTFKNQNHCDALAEPPANDPPANDPPANDPPANDPPVNDPPADNGGGNGGSGDTGNGGDTDNGGGGTNSGDTGGNAGGTTEGAAATTASEGEGDGGVVIQQAEALTCPEDFTCVRESQNNECEAGDIFVVKFEVGSGFEEGDTLTDPVTGVVLTVTDVNEEGEILGFTFNGADYAVAKAGNDPDVRVEEGEEWTAVQNALSHVTFCNEEDGEEETGTIQICKDFVAQETTEGLEADFEGPEGDFGEFTLEDEECEPEEEGVELEAGVTYSFEEILANLPEGFDLTDINCDGDTDTVIVIDLEEGTLDIDLAAGEDIVCTFVNTEEEILGTAQIVICKETVPAEVDFDFDFTGEIGDFTLNASDEENCFFSEPDLAAGLYDITEEVPFNWELVLITCENDDGSTWEFGNGTFDDIFDPGTDDTVRIDLEEGDIVTCTFTNEQGELEGGTVFCKETDPESSQEFTFNVDVELGENGDTFSGQVVLSDDQCITLEELADELGFEIPVELDQITLVIEEVDPDGAGGWTLVEIDCGGAEDGIDLPAVTITFDPREELPVCIFFNERETPPPPPGDDDDADDDDDSDVGGVRQPRTSQVGGVRSPGKPGVGTGDGSFEPFASFKDSADATSTWLPAVGFLAAMGLAGMAVAHVYRGNGKR